MGCYRLSAHTCANRPAQIHFFCFVSDKLNLAPPFAAMALLYHNHSIKSIFSFMTYHPYKKTAAQKIVQQLLSNIQIYQLLSQMPDVAIVLGNGAVRGEHARLGNVHKALAPPAHGVAGVIAEGPTVRFSTLPSLCSRLCVILHFPPG